MRLIGVVFVLGACHAGSVAGPDTPGGPGDDALHGLGMLVSWRANPTLPGVLNDKLTVTEATFQVDHFQLVADSVVDPASVTHSKYQLVWDGGTRPEQDSFPKAPPGVYSQAALVMMGGSFGEDAFRIAGTWRDLGPPIPFEIHDRNQLSITLDCNETLPAAGSAMIKIKVDLRSAIGGIDFKKLTVDEDGELELHDGQELLDFRDRLQDAFSLDN